jgi:hypothetical protein
MGMDDGDELVPFHDVRVIRASAPALLCRIASRCVWLPRGHIVASLLHGRPRHALRPALGALATEPAGPRRHGDPAPQPPISLPRLPVRLHLVRREVQA